MNIVAGIIGLLGAIAGLMAGFVTAIFGEFGSAFLIRGSDAILVFGWFFLICSLLFIILSASCFTAKNRIISAIVLLLSISSTLFAGIAFFG